MSYAIRGLVPRTDLGLGSHIVCVELPPHWPSLVEASGLTEEMIGRQVERLGNFWLDACGFTQKSYDGERLYEARHSIRIGCGKWGVEHISVPGNACGLDIDERSFGCLFPGGARLCPHNVDSWRQVQLLLIVFTEIAESILLFARSERRP